MAQYARQIVEKASNLIIAEIQSKFPEVAAQLRSEYNQPRVDTQAFKEYFISDRFRAFRAPACFVVVGDDGVDFQKDLKGANHVNARIRFNVSAVIEAKDEDLLTLGVYQYQAILHKILDQTNLTEQNGRLKISIVVNRATFSPLYQPRDATQGFFRKECVLECDVYSFEGQ
jgi:hypothetical protein